MSQERFIAIYGRVSEADERDLSSVPDQIAAGRKFAASAWPSQPIIEFGEVVTARDIGSRPEFCRLLQLCDEGKVARVIVRDQDRLSRSDTVETLHCIAFLSRKNVEVWQYRTRQQIRCDDPYSKMMTTFVAGVATFEREIAAARTRDKMTSMRREGKWTGGHVPKGYVLKDGTLAPAESAIAVRRIFEIAAQSGSLSEAWKEAQPLGLWKGKQSLQYALGNRIYVGEWRLPDGTWLPRHHEPLVTPETFERAQRLARLPYNIHERVVERVWLLAGLVRCESCNRQMTHFHVRKRNGLRIFYYQCPNCRRCPTKRIPAHDLEEWIWVELAELCKKPEIIADALSAYEQTAGMVSEVETARLALLNEKLKVAATKQKTIKAYLDAYFREGRMPPMSYGDDLAVIEQDMASLRQQIDETKAKVRPPERISAERFVQALREVLAEEGGNMKRRQAVVRALVSEIRVGKEDIVVAMRNPLAAKAFVLKDGTGGRFDFRPVWLPDLDSNQEPCD